MTYRTSTARDLLYTSNGGGKLWKGYSQENISVLTPSSQMQSANQCQQLNVSSPSSTIMKVQSFYDMLQDKGCGSIRELSTRKPNRLKNYDYSQSGYYFITICIKDKHELLWRSVVGARIARPSLSGIGEVVEKSIENIPHIYKSVTVDKYVVMPNHVHLILIIGDTHGRALRAPTISMVINQMKGYVSKQIGYSIWQKLFHDHIIRNEADFMRIWKYIDENPMNWQDDCFYPQKAPSQQCMMFDMAAETGKGKKSDCS
jgi:REP element-mobilizing transposase RayT